MIFLRSFPTTGLLKVFTIVALMGCGHAAQTQNATTSNGEKSSTDVQSNKKADESQRTKNGVKIGEKVIGIVKGDIDKALNNKGNSEVKPSVPSSPTDQLPSALNKSLDVSPAQKVEVNVSSVVVIQVPRPIGQVFLTDSKIADVQLGNPLTAYVYGRTPGNIEVLFTSQDNQTVFRYDVTVKPNLSELRRLIEKISPLYPVDIISLPQGILLQGTVDSGKVVEDIRTIAQQFVGSSGTVVNQLTLKKATQVNLRVRVVEIEKRIIKSMGINWQSKFSDGHFTFGVQSGQAIDATTTANFATVAERHFGLGARFINGRNDLAALIDALAQENLATILAEPNLITRSGEEANFLVGGEYPYPVVSGTGASATTTIQFKQYGISLSFTPTVIGNSISLHVKPEVSDIDDSQEQKDLAGNSYPALRTRRAESTLELGHGQSMVMAGLLSNKTSNQVNKLPGLAEIPILGSLFRSQDFQSDKTELVIIVTPYIIQPIDKPEEIKVPFQGMQYVNPLHIALFGGDLSTPVGSSEKLSSLLGEAGFSF